MFSAIKMTYDLMSRLESIAAGLKERITNIPAKIKEKHETKKKKAYILNLIKESNELLESDPVSGFELIKKAEDLYSNLNHSIPYINFKIKYTVSAHVK